MSLDLSNFIIDRVLSGVGKSSSGELLFKLNQMQNVSITGGSEATDIVDNVGTPIMTLYRGKTCEISAESAILDMNLAAVQMGAEKMTKASSTSKIIAPMFETIVVTADKTAYELKYEPKSAPSYIYALNTDSSLGDKYAYAVDEEGNKATAANAAGFVVSGRNLSVPTGVTAGTELFVAYDYETDAGIEIVNSAVNFPKSCELVLRAIGYNPCEKDNKLGCYIIFPSFEMSPDFDLSLNAGDAQSFSGKASQDYCSAKKELMRIVVVDDEDDTF